MSMNVFFALFNAKIAQAVNPKNLRREVYGGQRIINKDFLLKSTTCCQDWLGFYQ